MTEAPQPKENLIITLKKIVSEARQEARLAWKSLSPQETAKLIFGSALTITGGVSLAVLGEESDVWPITYIGGGGFGLVGLAGISIAWLKTLEMSVKPKTVK